MLNYKKEVETRRRTYGKIKTSRSEARRERTRQKQIKDEQAANKARIDSAKLLFLLLPLLLKLKEINYLAN